MSLLTNEVLSDTSHEPVQTAAVSGQAMRLLEAKLEQADVAEISLSVNDASELLLALRSGQDASLRLQDVEQKLSEATEEFMKVDFFSKYADYAGILWRRQMGRNRRLR